MEVFPMKSQSKAKRHPSTGCVGLDKMLDGLSPDGLAACLACTILPFDDAKGATRLLAALQSRIGKGPAADPILAERAEARRRAVNAALRNAHMD